MIKINDEIIATAEQNIVITQANYDKLTTAEKNNPLKTYFISDSSIAAQNLVANAPAAQPMSLDDDDFAASVDDGDGIVTNGNGTEYVVADKDGNVVGPMEDQNVGSTDFVDTDQIGLNIADAIGNASMLSSYGGDGTIIGAIADLYKRLGVEPDTSGAAADDAPPLTYSDYLGMIGDRSVLDQFNMPNVTAALMDLFDRIADAENKAEIARVNAEDAMKAQAEAEAAKAAAEKAQKEAEAAKTETEKDLANATNRADNAEASASDAWKQLHDTTEELNAEKTKNERLQSELDAAKKSEENKSETTEPGESTDTETTAPGESTDTTGSGETTDTTESGETTDKGDTTPPESTDETTPGSSEDKSTSESESTDTVTGETDASTETTENGESTEAPGTTDQSSETTESPEETTTENKSEETVETPSTESTEEPSVKEETPSETTTPATEDSAPASSDEEK